jgi:hypothetical protein
MGATLGVMLLMFLMSTLAINHVVLERRLQQIEQKYQKNLDRLVDEIEYEQTMRQRHRQKFQAESVEPVGTEPTQLRSPVPTAPKSAPQTSTLIASYAASVAKPSAPETTSTKSTNTHKTAPQTSDLIAKYAASVEDAANLAPTPAAPQTSALIASYAASVAPKPNINSQIQAWARSKNQNSIPALVKHSRQQDAATRSLVAEALGQLASLRSQSPQAEKAIATLGQLSRDRSLTVRQSAINALAQIKSDKVIAHLIPALKSPNGAIVRTASGAIAKLKYYQTPAQVAEIPKVAKPKPTSSIKK